MTMPKALERTQLRTTTDASRFDFETTDELSELTEIIGQPRATEALRFGIDMPHSGYNIFALGPPGMGKHSLIRQLVTQQAATRATPDDWCYVNNFDDPNKPVSLKLPAGQGAGLRHDMERLVEDLLSMIPAAFESGEYRKRRQDIEDAFDERREQAFQALQHEAEQREITLVRTPDGFAFAPTRKGEVIPEEEYDKLPEDERERIEGLITQLQERLQQLLREIPLWMRETRRRIKELDRETTRRAVSQLIDELRRRHAHLPGVLRHLEAVRDDIIENAVLFRQAEDTDKPPPGVDDRAFNRYCVNILVDRGHESGAPVVYCDHPTLTNLLGRTEHIVQMGALITDFTQIRAGTLHRANGGYLVLDANKVLGQPYAWEALKRVLRAREINIESLAQILSLVSTVSLEPEAIPLDVKLILVGDRLLYYLLAEYDPDFVELFKVAADFDDHFPRNDDNQQLYARLLATLCKREKTRPLDRHAVARLIDQSARLAQDSRKLSTHMRGMTDLLHEADYLAARAGHAVIHLADVEKAIETRTRRLDRVRERMHEEILDGTLLIDTDGAKAGQINGLTVIQMGDFSFGLPTRITATARLGEGELLDIQREADLGGPIHAKGVMTLSAFLGARYARNQPLSLSATLAFEQTYGMIEGDSASVAELCCLLSALSGIPVKQSLAVTGSIDQHGLVQAIGGINEKIEGFFDICRQRGLNGEQGVIMPDSNVANLMLREDVVQATQEGRFFIYPVSTVDQALALLTGIEAGERGENGLFREGTVNAAVEERLARFTLLRQRFSEQGRVAEGPNGQDG